MTRETPLAQTALRCTAWAARWYPPTWMFPAFSVIAVALAVLFIGGGPVDALLAFGHGVQRSLVVALWLAVAIVTSHLLATTPAVDRVIDRIAALPRSARGAVCFAALIGMLLSLLSWSFSLVFTPLLVRAMARRPNLGMDYRAAGAAAYLGLGSTWALGLSSFAPLPRLFPPDGERVDLLGITAGRPLGERLFSWPSVAMVVALVVVSLAVCWWTTPLAGAKTVRDLGMANPTIQAGARRGHRERPRWLEEGPFMDVLLCGLGLFLLGHEIATKPLASVLGNLNTYYLLFVLLALALHRTPARTRAAISLAYPSVGGPLLMLPVYGGVAALLTQVHGGDGGTLVEHVTRALAHVSSSQAFSVATGACAAAFGFVVPGGDSAWLTDIPYVMHTADTLNVRPGWIQQAYDVAVALPNLIHPFWMLPLLGVMGLKARDIVGFTIVQFVVHVPLVFGLLWLLSQA